MVAIVVGKEKDFDRPLDSSGFKVDRVDIAIPPPPSRSTVGPATPEALARGQEWLRRAADLAGGSAAFAEVRSEAVEQEVDYSMQGQTVHLAGRISWAFPDHLRVDLDTPMGSIVQGYDGKQGWASQMGQARDDPRRAESVRQQYERSLFRLFGHPEQVQAQALDAPRAVDGTDYRAAFVRSEVLRDWVLMFDGDGRLARMEYQSTGPSGPALETQVLGDWRAVGSLQLPHALKVLQNGAMLASTTIKGYTLNPALADSLFQMPAH
jgi:outer membrane lipoprotein-sorting protein